MQAVIWAAVMPQTSPSVLVIRLDAIGDALALTPLLAALRERAIPVDLVCGPSTPRSSPRARRARSTSRLSHCAPQRAEIGATIRRFGARLREQRLQRHARRDRRSGRLPSCARGRRAGARRLRATDWGKPLKTIWASFDAHPCHRAQRRPRPARAARMRGALASSANVSLGNAPIPRDPSVLRPLVLERDVPRGERIAFQVSDKWERLGIEFEQVVRRAARCGERSATCAQSPHRANGDYAQRVEAASGIAGRTLRRACPVEGGDRGRRRARCARQWRRPRRGNGRHADASPSFRRFATSSCKSRVGRRGLRRIARCVAEQRLARSAFAPRYTICSRGRARSPPLVFTSTYARSATRCFECRAILLQTRRVREIAIDEHVARIFGDTGILRQQRRVRIVEREMRVRFLLRRN